jgi:hypothetical protein
MDWIILLIGLITVFCGGCLIGGKLEEVRREQIVEEERRHYMKMLKSEYDRGYHNGFMAKVTPNALREVLGLPPVEEKDARQLEDT